MACRIGQPFVTTDYPSVQRAIEIGADRLLAAKSGMAGVYDQDPNLNSDAVRFDNLTFDEAIRKELAVMDPSAFSLARDHQLPIVVFDITSSGAMKAIVEGKKVGTSIR